MTELMVFLLLLVLLSLKNYIFYAQLDEDDNDDKVYVDVTPKEERVTNLAQSVFLIFAAIVLVMLLISLK